MSEIRRVEDPTGRDQAIATTTAKTLQPAGGPRFQVQEACRGCPECDQVGAGNSVVAVMACLGELPGEFLTRDRVFLHDRFTGLQIIGQSRTALVNDTVFPEDDPVPEILRVPFESLSLGGFLPESLSG